MRSIAGIRIVGRTTAIGPKTGDKKRNCTRVADLAFPEVKVSWRQSGDFGRSGTLDGDSVSYIDTFDNEFVGYFGGIPVYHPLEVVPALPIEDPRDFSCSPENLVIGGGSGEHPGIVVKAPGEAVVYFVHTWLDETPLLSPDERQALRPAIEAWPDAYDHGQTRRDWRHIFEFAGWSAADYVAFSTRCASRAFHRPFDPGLDPSLEGWLAASVGEFIFFAMPELALDVIYRLGELRNHVLGDIYRNILLLPPGYHPWGRREVDSQVIWGISAWQIQRGQNPRTNR